MQGNKCLDSSDENQFKNHSEEHRCKLKIKQIYGHVTEGQENVKPFLASAGCLHISKGNKEWKMLNFQESRFCRSESCRKTFLNTC